MPEHGTVLTSLNCVVSTLDFLQYGCAEAADTQRERRDVTADPLQCSATASRVYLPMKGFIFKAENMPLRCPWSSV